MNAGLLSYIGTFPFGPSKRITEKQYTTLIGWNRVADPVRLALLEADRRDLEATGRRPHWRFRLEPGPGAWDDAVRGPQAIDVGALSDPVVVRADGQPTYTLASIVDDLELGVTDVIRGEDHVTNTAVQIQMFEALGAEPPRFAHEALLVGRPDRGDHGAHFLLRLHEPLE